MEQFRVQSRIPDDALDFERLSFFISAAREYVEAETQLACLPQTWDYSVDEAPYGTSLFLPMSPVISVTSVTTYDTVNTPTVLSGAAYLVDTVSRPARIVLNDGYSWPGALRRTGGVVIRYVAGHANAELVPVRLRQAILMLAGEFYERREATASGDGLVPRELPYGVEAMLARLRVYGP
jgi:uncharacterized phiE125 gp8 family phage protein